MKNSLKVAVIGAMDCEINTIKECLENIETIQCGKLTVYKGYIGNNEIFLSKSGVGKVCAAINTQFIIDKFHPDYIINTGVAGGIAPELEVGDIVIATSLVQHDFDATALGYVKGYACTGGDNQKPTWFYTDENLIKAFGRLGPTQKLARQESAVQATTPMRRRSPHGEPYPLKSSPPVFWRHGRD